MNKNDKMVSEVKKAINCMNRLRVMLAKTDKASSATRGGAITRTACMQGDLDSLRNWVSKVQEEVEAADTTCGFCNGTGKGWHDTKCNACDGTGHMTKTIEQLNDETHARMMGQTIEKKCGETICCDDPDCEERKAKLGQ